MKKIAIVLSTMLLVGMIISIGHSQPANKSQEKKVKRTMELKLEHAKDVLEGLAMDDHKAIAKNAQELSLLSLESNWQVLQTPKYAQLSADFRGSANALSKAGKDKNLDAATLAYVEMTLQCVKCHKYVRSVKIANLDVPSDVQFALR